MKFFVRTIGLILILTCLMMVQTTPTQAAPDEQVFGSPILVVNTSFLNVRTGPSANFSVLTTVVGGTELPVLGTAGDEVWYQVSTIAGVGWVNLTFTIPRGDFTNVPLVTVTTQPTTASVVVDVPSATVAGSVAAPTTTTTTVSFGAARVNVNAYQFPTFASNVVTTLFDQNSSVFYPIVGDASNGTTLFVALDIPGFGIGWVEANKLIIEQRDTTTVAATSSTITAPAISEQGGGPSGEIVVAPEAIFTANVAVVNTSFLNVRSGPGAQFTAIFTARGGSQYNVAGISSDGVWFLVQGPFGQGWVNNQFVLFRGVIETVPIIRNAGGTIATPVVVIGNAVQLYAGPGVNFGLLGSVAGPVEAEIVARDADFEWIQINTSAGFGWVLASQVTLRGDSGLIPIVAG
jgi:uncharacterized protein YgiM (DUF1202 family)